MKIFGVIYLIVVGQGINYFVTNYQSNQKSAREKFGPVILNFTLFASLICLLAGS